LISALLGEVVELVEALDSADDDAQGARRAFSRAERQVDLPGDDNYIAPFLAT
jgi:hypothetical protein